MTAFEEFASALGVPITVDEYGLYTGFARALAVICIELIMQGYTEPELLARATEKFYQVFPYMKN